MPKTTRKYRDWSAEQRDFVRRIAPDSHFHIVFDAISDVHFFAKNLNGETLFFSQGLLGHHGLSDAAEMLGKTDWDLTPGAWANKYVSDDEQVIRTGKPLLGIFELWFDEVGLPDFYLTNKYPVKDDDGQIIGIMGTIRPANSLESANVESRSIMPAIELLRASLEKFPPIESLAERCFLSPRQLERQFKAAIGISPRTYWIKFRIKHACNYLKEGRLTIAQIAIDLGFCDQSKFTQHFRKHVGMPPKEYQKKST